MTLCDQVHNPEKVYESIQVGELFILILSMGDRNGLY